MRQLIADRNDRLRAVAYAWFELHKDPTIVPALVAALAREQSEFVRPALTRAIAAYGDQRQARDAILPLVIRGEDDFRGAVIEALGDYRAAYAVAPILDVAKLEGPLQDDAITALGRSAMTCARDAHRAAAIGAEVSPQPSIAAALCLLGVSCVTNEDYLTKALVYGATHRGLSAAPARGGHAARRARDQEQQGALTSLLDAGVPARDPARAPIALAVGAVAFRNPARPARGARAQRKDRDGAIELLRDAFDMLARRTTSRSASSWMSATRTGRRPPIRPGARSARRSSRSSSSSSPW